MFQNLIHNLTEAIRKPLPGKEAHLEMAHYERIFLDDKDVLNYKSSAVIVLLFPNVKNEISVLLIERSIYDGHHSGQIALPGGKKEPYDIDLKATAIREFFEETGSSETPVVIGKLSPVFISVSNFIVEPYVSYVHNIPNYLINDKEVSKLIEFEFNDLLNQKTERVTCVEVNDTKIMTPYFMVEEKIIWGATAMILNELRLVILKNGLL